MLQILQRFALYPAMMVANHQLDRLANAGKHMLYVYQTVAIDKQLTAASQLASYIVGKQMENLTSYPNALFYSGSSRRSWLTRFQIAQDEGQKLQCSYFIYSR